MMKELLKECVSVLGGVAARHTPLTQGMHQDLLRRCYAALAAEEKREPDALPTGATIRCKRCGEKQDIEFRYVQKSIAPPQVKSEPEKVAEEDAPQPGQPADGAALCPRCGSGNKGIHFFPDIRTSSERCNDPWHDSKPAAPDIDSIEPHDYDSAMNFLNIAKRQRDAALREISELKSKLAQIPNDQYCTPRDK